MEWYLLTKRFHIQYTKKVNISSHYKIDDTIIMEVSKICDLDVVLGSRLNIITHIDTIVIKSTRMFGFINLNTKALKLILKLHCFTVYFAV